jgi:outer membrane lipoprotein-sorting protein
MALMHRTALFVILLSSMLSVQAQTGTPAEKSDPEAKKLLDRVRKQYQSYKSLDASFALTIEVPGAAKEVQKGKVSQEGDKFRLDMTDQLIVSDAKTTWVYLKKNKEIQVDNADKNNESAFLTPQQLLGRYEKGDYLYAIAERSTVNGRSIAQVEFKPVDKRSEYAKLRVSIDEKAGTVESIKAFAKDGSRYTFAISALTPNKAFAAGHFTLDTKQYPGVRVEDLRM